MMDFPGALAGLANSEVKFPYVLVDACARMCMHVHLDVSRSIYLIKYRYAQWATSV